MESFGNLFEEEWHNLDKMFTTNEGLMFRVYEDSHQFIGDSEHLVDVSDSINPNFYHFFSQENSISSSDASNGTISILYPNHDSFPFCPSSIVPQLSNDVCDQSIQFHTMNAINNSSSTTQLFTEENIYLTQGVALEKARMENPPISSRETLKNKLETPEFPNAVDDEVKDEETDKIPKKRIRVSSDNKNKKNEQPKKNRKMNETEERIQKYNGQSSSSCSSNDDLSLSQDLNGTTRASRGTATDPQSVYARKRRERINERLKILQTLVPNGTKVDISTMLEEAVEYVKFLKLQIQLLSSDDMWMYAPIAYNGMDMGLYQSISQNLRN